ncbi:MAG: hypothetical protein DMG15_03445 [Acidobacteria bacterium]|nr:MAG: hypothetical protein DMG16_04050 [Acidobacteriota bacterium]PYS16126.1 MAG: hypothetical protein DMG15_03445 [Acidobacteriota bacterium]
MVEFWHFDEVNRTPYCFLGPGRWRAAHEQLLAIFVANPRLGVAGGDVLERWSGRFQRRFGYTEDDVPGAIQFFRCRCYEDIGSQLTPLLYLRQEQLGRIRREMRVPKRGIPNPRKNAA